jgi:DNA (cytosine-5)-methyltransferase 1
MKRNGWEGAAEWASRADDIAPTLVGGSKKHGGADLGPTQAKKHWRDRLGVDALGLADEPPPPGFVGHPRLTVPMAALLQGFPARWPFQGGKTAAYRQVGNAFPPPVAQAVGRAIIEALSAADIACVTRIGRASGEPADDASTVAA